MAPMGDEFSYIANEAICHSAIEEISNGINITDWLEKYQDLYENVTPINIYYSK